MICAAPPNAIAPEAPLTPETGAAVAGAVSTCYAAPGYEPVLEAFLRAAEADPGGAQLCVYRKSEIVVDAWTGRDVANDRAYTPDLLTVVMSCTKGATALCAAMLAERGQLDVEAPVARYWPDFASNGKERVTVAHCLSHAAGLPAFPAASGIHGKALADWDRCARTLAAMAPLWPAGEAASYHSVTFGTLVGEVIRRVTGKTVGQFFTDEIAGPLAIDFHIGAAETLHARVAPHIPPTRSLDLRPVMANFGVDTDDFLVNEILSGFDAIADTILFINTPEGRACELPAVNGVANARGLAKMYAATIGAVDGVRLLSTETANRARASRTRGLSGPGQLAKLPPPPSEGFGLGFELSSKVVQMLGAGSFGHTGAGGRLGFAHPESGVAVGYCCNSMLWDNFTPDPRWAWLAPLRVISGVK